MANASTIFQLLLARGALGFVSGTMAAEVAYMADLTWKSDRAYWVNLQARLQAAGCLLGPAIGGMVEPYERKRFESHFEFEHLCYAISGLCVLNFIIGLANHVPKIIANRQRSKTFARRCDPSEVSNSSLVQRLSRQGSHFFCIHTLGFFVTCTCKLQSAAMALKDDIP